MDFIAYFHDVPYIDALDEILFYGEKKPNRTGIDTIGLFGMTMKFDLQKGFPLLTTKKIHWKSVIGELLWFMRGDTNIKWLNDNGITIWDEWADEKGNLGPVYGKQWRDWEAYAFIPQLHSIHKMGYGIDQLAKVVETLRTNPNDRRMIVSAWNPGDLHAMALPPCHMMYQFHVRSGTYLDCQMYQRSCDMFLGVPFNIASYSALVHIIARITGYQPGRFIWVGGDCHIYENHTDQVKMQMERQAKRSPRLVIADDAPLELDGPWEIDHFQIEDYDPHPAIKAKVAV